MGKKHKTGEAVYQKIAADIAEKIAAGKYAEGELVPGRSLLAAQYSVSPETIRRAGVLLAEWGVTASEAAGIKIISRQRAAAVMGRLQSLNELAALKNSISEIIEMQHQQQKILEDKIESLLAYIERTRLASPILPYEIVIKEGCRFLGKKISEINFWQQTGVTVVAISRGDVLDVSPGPNAVFEAGDTFIFVGPEGSYSQVQEYLYSK